MIKGLRPLLRLGRNVATGALDSYGPQVEKRSVIILASSMSAAGVVWGTIYLAFGEPFAAAFPYGYAALTLVNTLTYRLAVRDRLFRSTQVLLTLLLPFLLMLALGGFTNSSAVILWSLVAPVAALVVIGERSAVLWFAAYAVLIVIGGILEPFGRRSNNLPPIVITAFFVMNVTAVSALTFVLLRYFFVQKNAAVRAYIQQELALRQSEKLATLGKLSAGVAHELNNPAAAARRGTALLGRALADLQRVQLSLGALALSDTQKEELARLDRLARDRVLSPARLDALALSDREHEIGTWLVRRGITSSPDCAATLAEMGYDLAELGELTGRFPPRCACPARLVAQRHVHRPRLARSDRTGHRPHFGDRQRPQGLLVYGSGASSAHRCERGTGKYARDAAEPPARGRHGPPRVCARPAPNSGLRQRAERSVDEHHRQCH